MDFIFNLALHPVIRGWFFISCEPGIFGFKLSIEKSCGGYKGLYCHYIEFLWFHIGICKIPYR